MDSKLEATIMELYTVILGYIGLGFRVYRDEGLGLPGGHSRPLHDSFHQHHPTLTRVGNYFLTVAANLLTKRGVQQQGCTNHQPEAMHRKVLHLCSP